MRTKQITHKDEMSDFISNGITKIASIVKRTLGPGGLPIMIERVGQALDGTLLGPLITKDGVTVAEECFDPDPNEDLVIQAVKAICKKTNRVAGDGTTTAIVLGEAILKEALSEIKTNDLNPQLVRESIELASTRAISILEGYATPIKNDMSKIREVATISANGDSSIGDVIGQAFEKVGAEGVITVDEGHSVHTTIDVVEGFQIKRGAEAQDRFFNNADNTRFEAKNCCVVLFDGPIMNYNDLVPAFQVIAKRAEEEAAASNKPPAMPPIMFVANDFSQEAIQFLLIQKAQAGLSVCAVKSPHMTTVRTDMMNDMAVMLGGERLGNGNRTLKTVTFDDIGIVEKVVASKYTTTFYDGAGDEEEVFKRIDQLKLQKSAAENPYDAGVIADRIAALGQGIAKIGVGGTTDLEIKERYHRIEDALNAARAAISEGVIPGGGITLARVANELYADPGTATIGEKIISASLVAPFFQILENIGVEDKMGTLNSIPSEGSLTYDAREKKVVDAMEVGIIDPLKVTKTALQNAVSIAALLSTCGGGIVYTRPTK